MIVPECHRANFSLLVFHIRFLFFFLRYKWMRGRISWLTDWLTDYSNRNYRHCPRLNGRYQAEFWLWFAVIFFLSFFSSTILVYTFCLRQGLCVCVGDIEGTEIKVTLVEAVRFDGWLFFLSSDKQVQSCSISIQLYTVLFFRF